MLDDVDQKSVNIARGVFPFSRLETAAAALMIMMRMGILINRHIVLLSSNFDEDEETAVDKILIVIKTVFEVCGD